MLPNKMQLPMDQLSLSSVIDKLKSSPRVKGVFSTGSTATRLNPASDIDLVILLDKNKEGIKSIYTTIEKRFSDIFFFDVAFVSGLKKKKTVSGNEFEGMFLDWLRKGKIEYDPLTLLQSLKKTIQKNPPVQKVPEKEKRDFWIKVNYNFIANSRYYNSNDKIYHSALELRLLYSVVEIITSYFSFRSLPWRGEKKAIAYFQQHDKTFLKTFQKYSMSSSLIDKMKYYRQLFHKVFIGRYQKWEKDFTVPIAREGQYSEKLSVLWKTAIR
jgi:predicted nucleotidyltransferase